MCLGTAAARVWVGAGGVSGACLGRVWGVSGEPGGKARVPEAKTQACAGLNPGASACDSTASNTTACSRMGNLGVCVGKHKAHLGAVCEISRQQIPKK